MDKDINQIRKTIIKMINNAGEGHIPSSLSIVEILYVIYKKFILNKYNINDPNRNVFILSKGHASAALYAILFHFNLLKEDLLTYCKSNSKLGGHPDYNKISCVEASTGSLAHGFPIALGIALAKIINGNSGNVFVLVGDGEVNEGPIWESIMVAINLSLNNIVLIIDNNRSQSYATQFDYKNILQSFGWVGTEIDGHNPDLIFQTIHDLLTKSNNTPKFIIANTVKGKGVSFMENNPAWHHRVPTKEEYKLIMEELS